MIRHDQAMSLHDLAGRTILMMKYPFLEMTDDAGSHDSQTAQDSWQSLHLSGSKDSGVNSSIYTSIF
jgi:hypothetical protein